MHSGKHLTKRYRFLAYAAAPIAVLVAALAVFEMSAPHDSDFTALVHLHITTAPPAGLAQRLAEVQARYLWFAGAVLDLAISVYAVGFCGWFLVLRHSRDRLRGVLMVGAGIAVLGIAYLGLATSGENTLFRVVYALPFRALECYERAGNDIGPSLLTAVKVIILIINVFAVVAPVAAVLAACSAMAPGPAGETADLDSLKRRIRALNDVLSVGSALLVVGILHMAVWLHWPAALLADDEMRKGMEGLALAISTYWGAAFSLMIVTAYVPAATRLHNQALAWIESHPKADGEKKKKGDEEDDLETAPARRLPQLAMMVAPLLAGPISSFLAGLGGK